MHSLNPLARLKRVAAKRREYKKKRGDQEIKRKGEESGRKRPA